MNKTKLGLWLDYNDTYIKIQKGPRLRAAMQYDPGVKFMRRGWNIFFIILVIISIIGRCF